MLTICEQGPKGTDCLGIFNYLLVSETRCIVATLARIPDGSRNTQEMRSRNQGKGPTLALAGLGNCSAWSQRAECRQVGGAECPSRTSAEMI